METDISRYRMNQEVKIVLVRNSVDLSKLSYSCTGGAVYLYGDLRKDPSGSLTALDVENLLAELSRLPNVRYIQCDFQEWSVSSEYGIWKVSRKKKAYYAPSEEEKTITIDDTDSEAESSER